VAPGVAPAFLLPEISPNSIVKHTIDKPLLSKTHSRIGRLFRYRPTSLRIFYRISLAITGWDNVGNKSMATAWSYDTNRTFPLDHLRDDRQRQVSPSV